jgi:ABC-type transport system involved in multi-copper enzyme maturation permease subunit
MLTNIRYILLTALRDKLFIGLLLGVLAATGISAMLGGTAMVENEAMTLTFSGGSARVILMIGLIVFVCFHVRQSFEQKEIDVLLSRPISRAQVMVSFWLGFSFVAFLLVLATVTLISFLPMLKTAGFFLWAGSLLAESMLVVAISLFAAFTLRSAVSAVLASLGIYAVGRMMGFFVATSESKLLFSDAWINNTLEALLKGMSLIIPRLDLFTQSEWLVYGLLRPQDFNLAMLQALIFIPLLLLAAIIDFMRKQF